MTRPAAGETLVSLMGVEIRSLPVRALAGIGGLAVAVACGPRSDGSAEAYLRAVGAAEAELESALAQFEARSADPRLPAPRPEALRVVEKARAARDVLEGMHVPSKLTLAWREELLFLNHVIPAFGRFADGEGGPAALEDLRSILERGRTHQRRGRDSLRS
ncbi:MAG: hypothetical protein ACRD1B_00150 [Thermoanaerobaculia bacterium]